MRRLFVALCLSLTAWLGLVQGAVAACASGGCISAGPRLASVSSTRGPLLNALVNTLGGGSINLTAGDWNTIAAGDVSLAKSLSALQASLNVSTPQQALTANATVAQIVTAMATAAQQEGRSTLAAALNTLQAQVTLPSTIRLGDLIVSDGVLGTTRVNALSVVMGTIELYNKKNVLTTPNAISISGVSLGLLGVLNSVTLQAQVVEPAVYVCGGVGSGFHSATIRVKLHLDLVSLALDLGILNLSASVGQLDLYIELAHADGVLTAVDAIANTLTVQVAPGVASLYLGTIADNVFWNRSRALTAADVTPGNIGSLKLLNTTVAITAKAAVIGQSPVNSILNFSGAGLQTRTAYTSANFATNLVDSLFTNLQLGFSPGGLLDYLLSALSPVLVIVVKPVVMLLTTSLVDPLLELLGIRLGEVDVTSGGTILTCAISGCVYQDANHSSGQDSGEAGTGVALYAKLVPTAAPTSASAVVSVDPTTGNYAFGSVLPAGYTIVVSTDGTLAQVTPAGPAGWVGTEAPTLSRSVTVTTSDLAGQRFGLYHGSKLSGTVFKDNGLGTGGVAHNGIKDGSESILQASVLNLTDATGATTFDTTLSDANGGYTLWLPFSTNGTALKVAQPADPTVWISVSGRAGTTGGTYSLAGDSVAFTHATGSTYTGVDFGDVPVNRLDTDGQMVVEPGATVVYPHLFHAGTAGQLSLSANPVGSPPAGWSARLFRDAACDGRLDGADTAISAAIALAPDENVCVLVKVFAPETAPLGAKFAITLDANFGYANIALSKGLQRQDLTTVAEASGLRLTKAVDRTIAKTGDLIVYTITFTNMGDEAVTSLKINDATPPYTSFSTGGCGSLPAGLSCTLATSPAAGMAGSLEWAVTGSLKSGGTGSVQFTVKVN